MYEVEWTTDVPKNEFGDNDLDAAVTHCKYFKTLEAARKFARQVYPEDFFGSVAINECHSEPYEPGKPGAYLEYAGHQEWYEGD